MGWYFTDTRSADLEELRQDYRNSDDPKVKRLAAEAGRKIVNESKRIRDMREALVKAHRKGDHDEIRNIHNDVVRSSYYQNGR
jgi:hypothetical protein